MSKVARSIFRVIHHHHDVPFHRDRRSSGASPHKIRTPRSGTACRRALLKSVNHMLDQVIAWGGALKPLRKKQT
jgi:hypothetical protein